MRRLGIMTCILGTAFAGHAYADTLILRTDRVQTPVQAETPRKAIECIVLEETATSYKVKTIDGVMTYPSSRVIEARRGSIEANVALDEQFEQAEAKKRQAARARRQREREWLASPEGQREMARREQTRRAEELRIQQHNLQVQRAQAASSGSTRARRATSSSSRRSCNSNSRARVRR